MNEVDIEKISNGYVVRVNGKKTFCDVPEAICGVMSEWVLEECKRLDARGQDAAAKGRVEVDMKAFEAILR